MNEKELGKVLNLHEQWLEKGGERADLGVTDLYKADLREANLQKAHLQRALLRDADLRDADLRKADLKGAALRGADLGGADLKGADLRDADLRFADLKGADLRGVLLDKPVKNHANIIKKVFTEVKEKFSSYKIDQSDGSCETSACIGGKLALYYHGKAAKNYEQGAHALAKDIGLTNEGMLRAWMMQTGLWWNNYASEVFASDVTAYAEEGSDINVEIVCNRWIDFAHKLEEKTLNLHEE